MMRSLYSGVSGLKNHQTRMDVIGNNISNVNTAGFKASRVIFQDIYSQTSKSASAGSGNVGGTNPMQIGLGVTLAAIDVLHTSAATQRTDNPTDLALEGDGYFVIRQPDDTFQYTRAGNMYIDNTGNLVLANGQFVQGIVSATAPVVDANGDYTYTAVTAPADGKLGGTGLELGNINLKGLKGIAIDENGCITGIDASGDRKAIAYIAIATFENNPGLEKKGSSQYAATPNSGAAVFSISQTNGAAKVNPGGLEMSNVDLANEFTDMIVTQRGFQANSRVITTSDSLLEELVNLKR